MWNWWSVWTQMCSLLDYACSHAPPVQKGQAVSSDRMPCCHANCYLPGTVIVSLGTMWNCVSITRVKNTILAFFFLIRRTKQNISGQSACLCLGISWQRTSSSLAFLLYFVRMPSGKFIPISRGLILVLWPLPVVLPWPWVDQYLALCDCGMLPSVFLTSDVCGGQSVI